MPSGDGYLVVENLANLQRALAKADKGVRLGLRKGLREVAEPVRRDAEALAAGSIPRIGAKWPRMRVGVTRNLIYVAPRQRGTKEKSRKRPNLAGLLLDRAMDPALERNKGRIEGDVEALLDKVATGFNVGV